MCCWIHKQQKRRSAVFDVMELDGSQRKPVNLWREVEEFARTPRIFGKTM